MITSQFANYSQDVILLGVPSARRATPLARSYRLHRAPRTGRTLDAQDKVVPMASSFRRTQTVQSDADQPVVVYDDGGSGLEAACVRRFGAHGCTVSCDAMHTVWVKRADGSKSVGLQRWMAERNSMEDLLDNVAVRLGLEKARALN